MSPVLIDTLPGLQKLPEKVMVPARNHVRPDGVLQVPSLKPGNTGEVNQSVNLIEVWKDVGIPPLVIARYLTDESIWKERLQIDELLQALGDNPHALLNWLEQMFGELYSIVQQVLNATSHPDHGFNDHSMRHILDLLDLFTELCRYGGFSEQEKMVIFIAIMSHDIGNVVSRKYHQILSALLFLESFEGDIVQDPFMSQAMRAVIWHEAGSVNGRVERLLDLQDNGDFLSSSELLERFSSLSTRIDSTLRLLDKLSIGRDRVINGHPVKRNRLVDDPHFLVNALFERENVQFDQTGKNLQVTFGFSLYPDSRLNNSNLLRDRQVHRQSDTSSQIQYQELMVSDTMRKDYNDGKRVYFESAAATLLSLYKDRMMLVVLDLLNIYQDLEEVELCFVDPNAFYHLTDSVWPNHGQLNKNKPIILKFHRSEVAQQLRLFQSYSVDEDPRALANQINWLHSLSQGSRKQFASL